MNFLKNNFFYFVIFIFSLFNLCAAQIGSFSITKKREFVQVQGYPFETYSVLTPDGYILKLERIPYGNRSQLQPNVTRPIALLMPGLWCESSFWLASGANNSLAFLLADQGYDVWLGNNRGTFSSRKHKLYNPNWNEQYWDFSFHELAVYDLQAIIDHIIDHTNSKNITYIGHSQGAAILFILASEMPQYNSKVKVFIAVAPAVYLSDIKSELVTLVPYYSTLKHLAEILHTVELLQYSRIGAQIAGYLCAKQHLGLTVCNHLLERVFGPSNETFDVSLLLQHYPAGSSARQAWHFIQLCMNGRFSKYDYESEGNIIKYGNVTVPDYDLRKVTVPTAIYYGNTDYTMSKKNIDKLSSQIQNTLFVREISDVNHLSIIIGDHANTKLFKDIIEFLKT